MQKTLLLKVVAKIAEAEDIVSFEFADPDGKSLPPFTAGAHIDVEGPTGVVRQYSLCSNPAERLRYQIGILRTPDSRGGSRAMYDSVNVGDIVKVSIPRNHFELVETNQHSLLIAGGIGITPILAMAERLTNLGVTFVVHYCARSLRRAAFTDRIRQSSYGFRVHHHFDEGPKDQQFNIIEVLPQQPEGTHLYVCGPTGFLDSVLGAARCNGWSEDHLHCEYFGATTGTSQGDRPFQIRIASTGKVITVAANQTAASALAEEGVDIPLSCEQGVCGTCITPVVDGEPDHRDHYLSEAERVRNDQFTPCCSRAKTSMLVLGL
ncbi:PDR/VanB family oxidoreductase [Paraburkholderia agricolaris]|uniref:PDR/VanB family oxidoreductase n=1 Tax=Paraburkholderia agricolaris TaxID=2152888 RepID=A0ABW8ZUV9_9BURK